MDRLTFLFDSQFIYALGWTIVHSFWQSLLIFALLSANLIICKRSSPEIRYGLSVIALGCCLLVSVKTFVYCYQDVTQASQLFTQLHNTFNTSQVHTWWEATFTTINPWLGTIVLFWSVGFIIQCIRYAYDMVLTQRLKTRSVSQLPDEWNERLQKLVLRLGINKSVTFMHSSKVNVPSVIGHFKPVILLPLGILTQLPQAHIEAIVLHELAHVKRHDYLINIVLCLIKVLFFFNPRVLAISKKISIERENICDDLAVKVCGDPLTFANSLSQFADVTPVSQSAMAASNDKYLLLHRVKRLFPNHEKLPTSTERLIALVCAGLLGLTLNVNAKSQPPSVALAAKPAPIETTNTALGQVMPSEIDEETPSSDATISKVEASVDIVNREVGGIEETEMDSVATENVINAAKSSQLPSQISAPEPQTTVSVASAKASLAAIKVKPQQEVADQPQGALLVAQNNATDVSSSALDFVESQNKKEVEIKASETTPQTPQQSTGRVYAITDKFSSFSLESPQALDDIEYVIFTPLSTSDTQFSHGIRKWRNVVSQYFSEVQGQQPRVVTLNSKSQASASFAAINSSLIAQVRIKNVALFNHSEGTGSNANRSLMLNKQHNSRVYETKRSDSQSNRHIQSSQTSTFTPSLPDFNISQPIQEMEKTEPLKLSADLTNTKFILEVIAEIVLVDPINYEFIGYGIKKAWLDSSNIEPSLSTLTRGEQFPSNSRTKTEHNADIIKNAWDILISHLQQDVYQVAYAIKNQELELSSTSSEFKTQPAMVIDKDRNLASQYYLVENSEFKSFIISSPDSLNDFENATYSPIKSAQVKLNSKQLGWKQRTTLALSNLAKQTAQTYLVAKNVPRRPEQIAPINNQSLVVQIDVKAMERYSRRANRIYRNRSEFTSGGSNYNRGAVASGTGISPTKDDVGGATPRKATVAMPNAFDTKQYLRGEFDITLLDPKTQQVVGHAVSVTAVTPSHSAFKKLAKQINAQNQTVSYEDMLLLALFEQVKTQLHHELSRIQQGEVSVKPIQLSTEQVKRLTDIPMLSGNNSQNFTVANLAY